ncbi:MAG TPA: class I SAM-dependent methyltransferase [Verrucomicrobiae bacterium]|nr:class I SAM-dependent methyltransferase [Verrucomicrobiae bacterium]
MNPATVPAYWDLMALQFRHQQPPLRPCAEDVRIHEETLRSWIRHHPNRRMNALLLGVTPELADMNWPDSSQLLAMERSQRMIEHVWPGDIEGHRRVICDNWFSAELPEQSFDVVIGDGVLTGLSYPLRYREIAHRVSRWLRPDGLLLLRAFIRPSVPETLERIAADLVANRIPRFDILKWRLAMSQQETAERGVELNAIHSAWLQLAERFETAIKAARWPQPTIETIELYAGRAERYSFPSLAELDNAFADAFTPVSMTLPRYAFGEQCPIRVYAPRHWGSRRRN